MEKLTDSTNRLSKDSNKESSAFSNILSKKENSNSNNTNNTNNTLRASAKLTCKNENSSELKNLVEISSKIKQDQSPLIIFDKSARRDNNFKSDKHVLEYNPKSLTLKAMLTPNLMSQHKLKKHLLSNKSAQDIQDKFIKIESTKLNKESSKNSFISTYSENLINYTIDVKDDEKIKKRSNSVNFNESNSSYMKFLNNEVKEIIYGDIFSPYSNVRSNCVKSSPENEENKPENYYEHIKDAKKPVYSADIKGYIKDKRKKQNHTQILKMIDSPQYECYHLERNCKIDNQVKSLNNSNYILKSSILSSDKSFSKDCSNHLNQSDDNLNSSYFYYFGNSCFDYSLFKKTFGNPKLLSGGNVPKMNFPGSAQNLPTPGGSHMNFCNQREFFNYLSSISPIPNYSKQKCHHINSQSHTPKLENKYSEFNDIKFRFNEDDSAISEKPDEDHFSEKDEKKKSNIEIKRILSKASRKEFESMNKKPNEYVTNTILDSYVNPSTNQATNKQRTSNLEVTSNLAKRHKVKSTVNVLKSLKLFENLETDGKQNVVISKLEDNTDKLPDKVHFQKNFKKTMTDKVPEKSIVLKTESLIYNRKDRKETRYSQSSTTKKFLFESSKSYISETDNFSENSKTKIRTSDKLVKFKSDIKIERKKRDDVSRNSSYDSSTSKEHKFKKNSDERLIKENPFEINSKTKKLVQSSSFKKHANKNINVNIIKSNNKVDNCEINSHMKFNNEVNNLNYNAYDNITSSHTIHSFKNDQESNTVINSENHNLKNDNTIKYTENNLLKNKLNYDSNQVVDRTKLNIININKEFMVTSQVTLKVPSLGSNVQNLIDNNIGDYSNKFDLTSKNSIFENCLRGAPNISFNPQLSKVIDKSILDKGTLLCNVKQVGNNNKVNLPEDETFIRFNKRGWICIYCANFNYESKYLYN